MRFYLNYVRHFKTYKSPCLMCTRQKASGHVLLNLMTSKDVFSCSVSSKRQILETGVMQGMCHTVPCTNN